MAGKETQVLILVAAVGMFALLLIAAAALFLFAVPSPARAPIAPSATGSGGGLPANEYVAGLLRAEQHPDGSWSLGVRLTHAGTQSWDTITVSGQVYGPKGREPWSATLRTPLPEGVPDQLDLDFATEPIPQARETLHLEITVDLGFSGLTSSGSTCFSQTLDFPPQAESR